MISHVVELKRRADLIWVFRRSVAAGKAGRLSRASARILQLKRICRPAVTVGGAIATTGAGECHRATGADGTTKEIPICTIRGSQLCRLHPGAAPEVAEHVGGTAVGST